jgi:hypothetical protein
MTPHERVTEVAADNGTYNWRVTVVSKTREQRDTLYLTTSRADARQAYALAIAVVENSWPPGTRIVEIVPAGRGRHTD